MRVMCIYIYIYMFALLIFSRKNKKHFLTTNDLMAGILLMGLVENQRRPQESNFGACLHAKLYRSVRLQ